MKKRYTARIHIGGGKYKWVGRFDTRRERDLAKAKARIAVAQQRDVERMTIEDWATRFLARYERTRKASSHATAVQALRQFRDELGQRPLVSFSRLEALDWVQAKKPGSRVLVTMFEEARDAELIDRNPFRGLTPRTRGRQDEAPPTEAEFAKLVESCSALKWYAPQMRSLLLFAAYSGMRPGEIFALEWEDIDIEKMRIRVQRRVWQGKVDSPKSNRAKTIALTPPARDALLGLPTRSGLVFRTKTKVRFSQSTLSHYWGKVTTKADLDFDFYLATKHYCVHYLWTKLDLRPRAIAAQMGWSVRTVDKMLQVYGHGDIGALDEVDAAFKAAQVVPLRDANRDAEGA